MNIKEHIEAGHYPLKREDYVVVPTRNGKEAWILTTDYRNRDSRHPILGFMPHKQSAETDTWAADGSFHHGLSGGASPLDLLPPPPRKVKVTGSIKYRDGNFVIWNLDAGFGLKDGEEITITGEREVPWT